MAIYQDLPDEREARLMGVLVAGSIHGSLVTVAVTGRGRGDVIPQSVLSKCMLSTCVIIR